MPEDIAIRVEHVSKDFVLPHEKVTSVKRAFTGMFNQGRTKEAQHALKDISFEIKKGEFFGIVGRNGSGKSTMLKILASIYQPTKGRVYTTGKLVPFIELGVGFNPELTGRENVYLNGAMLGFSEKEVAAMYDDIVSFAELERFMDQKLKNYSSGMQVRLAFSMATRSEADILLVDEVLAVGDADFQRKCFEYFKTLKKNRKTVVFVTHDMGAVREFCDRALLIDSSEVKSVGSPRDIAKSYSELFMEGDEGFDGGAKERWGTGDVQIEDVDVKLVGDHLKVTAVANVGSSPIEEMIYGIHIISSSGEEITATNNRLIDMRDVENIEPGSSVTFSWDVLNIFSDGKYYVTLTLVKDDQTVLDWYNEVASFTVKRREHSTTPVIPPMSVSYKLSNSRSSHV